MSGAALPVSLPFALPWIVFAAIWLVIGLVVIALARAAEPLLARVDAAQRSTLLLAIALLPLTVATLVTALGFLPMIGGQLVDPHCHPDVGCVAHVPMLHATAAHATLLSSMLFVATGSVLWSIGGRLRRSVALTTTLNALAAHEQREPFTIVESGTRFAYCVGLLKPQLFVTRGVLEMPKAQRDAVLAHELAHAARRDNLRRWLAGVSLWLVPKRARSRLLAKLAFANEEACDRSAGTACGAQAVAAALRALGTGGSHSATTGEMNERLRAIEAPARTTLSPALLGALMFAVHGTFTLVALDAAHHGSELVLDLLR